MRPLTLRQPRCRAPFAVAGGGMGGGGLLFSGRPAPHVVPSSWLEAHFRALGFRFAHSLALGRPAAIQARRSASSQVTDWRVGPEGAGILPSATHFLTLFGV